MRAISLRTSDPVCRQRALTVLVSLHLAIMAAFTLSAYGATSQVNRDTELLADFRQRLDGYMDLHGVLQWKGIPPEQTADVGQNQGSRRALAARIRAARRTARRGEIFTPAIAAMLRTAMNPQLRGATAAGTRVSIRDDAPARFALHVNGAYPEGASLPTVPPNVLAILPPLPEGLEYRIVDSHLLLMDVDAGIVVDYMFNVMCVRC